VASLAFCCAVLWEVALAVPVVVLMVCSDMVMPPLLDDA
jgi:hypothetical protein